MIAMLKQIELTPVKDMYDLLSGKKYEVIFIEGDTYNYTFGVINEKKQLVIIDSNNCLINIKAEGSNGSE